MRKIFSDNNQRLKRNNFDLLRLFFALSVCFVHAHELSGFSNLAFVKYFFSSHLAVQSFFIVSGFLVFMSYENSSSIKQYFVKRARRLLPAYVTMIIICAFGLFFISDKGFDDYFSLDWVKYLIANLTFLNFIHPSLPGVFVENKYIAVNGALWTLKIEVMFYLSVPVFALMFRYVSKFYVLISVYLFSSWYFYYFMQKGMPHHAQQLPGQLSYFVSGALLFYYLEIFERYLRHFVLIAILIFISQKLYYLPILAPISLAVLVITCALFAYLGNFGKYGDFSYGVYIIHFPLIQVLLASKIFANSPYLFLVTAVGLTLVGGVMMWNLVEKHWLRRR